MIDIICYYDKLGLLLFVKCNLIGWCEFIDNDLYLMRIIVCFKNVGVLVVDIVIFIVFRFEGDMILNDCY